MPRTTDRGPVGVDFSNRYNAAGRVVVVTGKNGWRDEGEEGERGKHPVSQSATGRFRQQLSDNEETLSSED